MVDAAMQQFDQQPSLDFRRGMLLRVENVRHRLAVFAKLHFQTRQPQFERQVVVERPGDQGRFGGAERKQVRSSGVPAAT